MLDRRRFLILGGASLGAGSLLAPFPGTAWAQGTPPSREAVFDDAAVPVLGNRRGDVTIVEWFDYQCPYCKKAYPQTARLVREDGTIRWLLKDWPILGPESVYAAKLTLALAVTLGRGEDHARAQAALMATRGRLTKETIDGTLRKAGFDPRALVKAYEAKPEPIDALLRRNGDQAYGFGFHATPSYVVGTTLYGGALDDKAMRAAVAKARSS